MGFVADGFAGSVRGCEDSVSRTPPPRSRTATGRLSTAAQASPAEAGGLPDGAGRGQPCMRPSPQAAASATTGSSSDSAATS